jgi:hypothetical protein
MERLRRGESHENTSQSLPPVGKSDQHLMTELLVPEASREDPTERENSEPPTLSGYLTLELDVSEFQAFMPEADAAATQPDWEMYGCHAPEVFSLDVPELLEPEESTLPGYLTLEIDLNTLGDMAPWRSSHNATSDEPPGKA